MAGKRGNVTILSKKREHIATLFQSGCLEFLKQILEGGNLELAFSKVKLERIKVVHFERRFREVYYDCPLSFLSNV